MVKYSFNIDDYFGDDHDLSQLHKEIDENMVIVKELQYLEMNGRILDIHFDIELDEKEYGELINILNNHSKNNNKTENGIIVKIGNEISILNNGAMGQILKFDPNEDAGVKWASLI